MTHRMRFTTPARRRISIAAGAVVLAFGAIVLSRARGSANEETSAETPGAPAEIRAEGPARITIGTPEVTGIAALTQGAVLARGSRELFAELRLEARDVEGDAARQPVAIAVVVDTSGSMGGDKIMQARRSVHELVARMHDGDRIAIVTYNHSASMLQELTPIAHAREGIAGRIESMYAGGSTNIPAGLELGTSVLSGAPPNMIRRLVLVSDGLDGSGVELTEVQSAVQARATHGMTTSALGVGIDYDERWLSTVADAGRGNYEFLARGHELAQFLTRELEQASTTVADNTRFDLTIPSGWRLTDVYGAQRMDRSISMGPLFAGERRRVTLRFEVAAGADGDVSAMPIALRYRSVANSADRNLDLGRLSVRVVSDEAQVLASRDVTLHAEAVAQQIDARQAQAIDAWRSGRQDEARQLTNDNLSALRTWRTEAPAARGQLDDRIEELENDMDNFGNAAGSDEGRAWGLGANARRRARAEAF
jgi:Ca-activated chloride channel family protein